MKRIVYIDNKDFIGPIVKNENIVIGNGNEINKGKLKPLKNGDIAIIVGTNLIDLFLNTIKRKGFVVTYVWTKCDCVETIKYNNANVFLLDIKYLSRTVVKDLLNEILIQKQWSSDGVHDYYVENLYRLGTEQDE